MRGDLTVTTAGATQVAFKNSGPFTKCITKIDRTTTGNAEDLDFVIPMYNLKEYSSYYSGTTGSLWFYSNDGATNFNNDIANDDNFKPFKYKAKLLEKTEADNANRILKNETITFPLKYSSNFWISLEMPLINWKADLKLKFTLFCLQLVKIIILMRMLLLIILFLLSETQNYMFLF